MQTDISAEVYVDMLFCSGISHSMCDENELLLRGQMLFDGSLEDLLPSEQLPLVYHIDDWHLYDNNDSFDDDNDDADQTTVTLISYVQHDWTDSDDFIASVSAAFLDSSEISESDDGPCGGTSEQGFYDVSMLSGGAISEAQLAAWLNDADKERAFVHPELKLEYIMANHHRQRRVAEQLQASDCPLEAATAPAAAAADNEDDDNKHCKLSREPSFVASGPQPSKVKPDDFWIRDVADTLPSDSEEATCVSQQCSCESTSVCSCGGCIPVDSKYQQNSADNSVRSSPDGRKVVDIAQQLAQEENSIDKVTELEAKPARSLSVYETEGISIEPGLVRRTVDLGVDVSASPDKTATLRSVSVYETEDISLEPGLVRRTRQEIEQRER